MEKPPEKRSAFDLLMSKKRDQKSKQENELNTSFNNKNNDSSSDIILIENKSITNQDIIEIDSFSNNDLTSTKKTTKKDNSNQDENSTKRDKWAEIDKKQIVSSYSLDGERKELFMHVQQYSDEDRKFLSESLDKNNKLKFEITKENLDTTKINLNASLNFDFSNLTNKFKNCNCQEKDSNCGLNVKDVIFSLNNSVEARKSNEFTSKSDDINDTLSAESQTKCSQTETERYSKRRRTEKSLPPKPEKKVKKASLDPMSKIIFENQELWTEKYQFKNEDEIVTNNSQFERLKEWLSNWKAILSKDQANNLNKSKISGSYDSSDSEYAYDSDASNTSNCSISNKKKFYSNAILLSGPYGCGKTSSIYSVAKCLGFKVFEVNSSSLRNKYQIIQELEGALNSHHVSNNKSTPLSSVASSAVLNKKEVASSIANFKLQNFFKLKPANTITTTTDVSPVKSKERPPTYVSPQTKTRKKRKISLRKETFLSSANKNDTKEKSNDCNEINKPDLSGSADDDANLCSGSSVKIHTNSLILFDEIDVVFKEDKDFFAAINHFIKKSKKPILLTTNDDYLQEKINLNIEKIDFVRPRIEAAIKFLKKVAALENKVLDTHTANKLIRECKFDMRRALMQFQALYFSNKPQNQISLLVNDSQIDSFDLNRHLNLIAFSKCKFHNELTFFKNIFFLDIVTKGLRHFNSSTHTELSDSFKKYDLFILRDGLTDNSSLNTGASFNPFNPFIPQATLSDESVDFNIDDFNKYNSFTTREHLYDLYETHMYLFNDFKPVKFDDWYKHGTINEFNYSSNVSVNRFALNALKLTTDSALSLDYRPYLHQISQIEEFKQVTSTSRRRYVNYLSRLNLGLVKEDYSLLAKSNLNETNDQASGLVEGGKNSKESLYDSQVFSNDS